MSPLCPLNHTIERSIFLIQGHRVLLDDQLARLYGVPVKVLNQAVKRNRVRFPSDFMFQLSWDEARLLRSQSVTLNRGAHRKYRPYAFTEQGVAMLSSVLRSPRAIQVNILIMRTFVKIRQMISANKDLALELSKIEKRVASHEAKIETILDVIRQLIKPSDPSKRKIGFLP